MTTEEWTARPTGVDPGDTRRPQRGEEGGGNAGDVSASGRAERRPPHLETRKIFACWLGV